jgi:carboxyl-terminal processing protease
MASDPGSPDPQGRINYTYLPVLSWVLVLLVFAWLAVWFFFLRPSTEERLQYAAFVQALNYIEASYVDEVDRNVLYQGAMEGMVRALGDRFSHFQTPDSLRLLGEQAKGQFAGIGIVLSAWPPAGLVEEVIEGGPAEAAGMLKGDLITEVDGVDVADEPFGGLPKLIRGEKGTNVSISVRRGTTDDLLTFEVTRGIIEIPNVEWEMLDSGMGLVRLALFDEGCADELADAFRAVLSEDAAGIILDLRGNNGGLVPEAVAICDQFLDDGLILAQRTREGLVHPTTRAVPGTVVPTDVPVVVLVDRGSASASEIVAGCLQGHGRAALVGTHTVGKGVINQVFGLRDGSGLMLTVARYELAGGKVIGEDGLTPDVVAGEMPEPPRDAPVEELRQWYLENRQKARQAQLDAAEAVLANEPAGE